MLSSSHLLASVRPRAGAGLRSRVGTKVSGDTTIARMGLLCAAAVVIGLAGGGAAVGLFKLIGLLSHLTLLHNVGYSLPGLRGYHPSWWIVLTAVAGAVAVSLFAMWSPVIRGHGIPESLEAILTRDSRIRPRAAIAKPLSAAVTIGTGGPFGAEGPIIVTGGSVGSLIGQVLSVSPAERKILLATGAAAGMAATFNTPIAAIILAIELVLFERSLRTIVPLSIACAIAAGVHILAFGTAPLFAVQVTMSVPVTHLPLFVIVGLVCGGLAVLLNKGLFTMEALFRRLPVKIFWWPAIGALGFSLIGMVEPRTLSMGYSAIRDTLDGRFTVAAMGALVVAKLFSWWIALGSQTSGGTLAPIFLIGATTGSLLGHGLSTLLPGMHISPGAFALVAMGATFGACSKAVLASIVFAAEVTGQYHMLIPLMIGAGVAELVAEFLVGDRDRIMTEKLFHRGFRVDFDVPTSPLRMRMVHQVMHEPLHLSADTTVGRARQVLADEGLTVMAVADHDRHYLGLVSAADLRAYAGGPGESVAGLISTAIAPIRRGEYLANALDRLTVGNVNALPVVTDGQVVGHLRQADIVAERYRYHTALETRQPGWASSLRRRRAHPSSPLTAHYLHLPAGTAPPPGDLREDAEQTR